MNKLFYIFVFCSIFISCSTDSDNKNEYQFIASYSANVTIGGVIGVTERHFEIGEIYQGTDMGDSINIKIAKHTQLNDNCPNSWCYQEFLGVPKAFLKHLD